VTRTKNRRLPVNGISNTPSSPLPPLPPPPQINPGLPTLPSSPNPSHLTTPPTQAQSSTTLVQPTLPFSQAPLPPHPSTHLCSSSPITTTDTYLSHHLPSHPWISTSSKPCSIPTLHRRTSRRRWERWI